jgi:hypothetical protein
MTTAFPLSWPEQFPRAKHRETGKFKTPLANALKNVQDSLRLFGSDSGKAISGLVISSNVTLGVNKPADPGVAIWFVWDGLQVCIPVDRYATVEANLQAIHHIVEARRVELRHGTLALVRATFTGFLSLPSPGGKKHWSEILGVFRDATADEIDAAYRSKAKAAHPDTGGSTEAMAALSAARDQARKDRG